MAPDAASPTRVILREEGLLLASDPRFPSVSTQVAGEPVKGSWWGHPQAQEIWSEMDRLEDDPDVTVAKLVSGKVTYLDRRLWPALLAVATSGEAWQVADLSETARAIRDAVDRRGRVRSDRIPKEFGLDPKVVQRAVRELEARLLVHSAQIHTEGGHHAKGLESWSHWARRVSLTQRVDPATGRKELETVVARLNERSGATGRVPWAQP